jgi:hypothetical protein
LLSSGTSEPSSLFSTDTEGSGLESGLPRVHKRTSAWLDPASVAGFFSPLQHKRNIYLQTDLVSDLPGLATNPPDSHVANPWGSSRSSTGRWWVANNNSGTSTLYSGTGALIPINGTGSCVVACGSQKCPARNESLPLSCLVPNPQCISASTKQC